MTKKSTSLVAIKHLSEHIGTEDNPCKAKFFREDFSLGFPGKFWDDETIRFSVEKFIKENSRLPSTREFDSCPYLPSHIVILSHYNMSVVEWLTSEFPDHELAPSTVKHLNYKQLTSSDLCDIFFAEFKRIRPTSSCMYNLERTPSTPTWQYIAKRCGLKTWTSLKDFSGVHTLPAVDDTPKLKVVRHIKNLTE